MSRSFFIAPIVEGHGEVQALPVLLRRFATGLVPTSQLNVNPALRVKAGSFANDTTYEEAMASKSFARGFRKLREFLK